MVDPKWAEIFYGKIDQRFGQKDADQKIKRQPIYICIKKNVFAYFPYKQDTENKKQKVGKKPFQE